ncbi:MAG: hypothetical protein ACRELY_08815, partial [Polyangiaceae bacterium]
MLVFACGKTAPTACTPKSLPSSATAPQEGAFRIESASLGVREADAGGLETAKSLGFDLDGKCTT